MKSILQKLTLFGAMAIFTGLLMVTSVAATTSIAKGYESNDSDIKVGMAVALSEESDSQNQSVERATLSNKNKYLGIVTRIDDSVVTISNQSATVYISNSGQYSVYASDVNGAIRKGDPLVLSPLKGILMKKSNDNSNDTSVAIALSDFDTGASKDQEVQSEDGGTRVVRVGQVDAEVNTSTIIGNEQQKFLSVFGESLTGKPVSELRVLIACVILLIVLIVEGSVIYGAVSSSITAVGRNPLSKSGVYKQLVHTSFLAILVLVFGIAGIYVVIWT